MMSAQLPKPHIWQVHSLWRCSWLKDLKYEHRTGKTPEQAYWNFRNTRRQFLIFGHHWPGSRAYEI